MWAGGGESLEAENKDAFTWQQVAQDTEGWRYLETFFVWDIDWKLEAKGRPGPRKQRDSEWRGEQRQVLRSEYFWLGSVEPGWKTMDGSLCKEQA